MRISARAEPLGWLGLDLLVTWADECIRPLPGCKRALQAGRLLPEAYFTIGAPPRIQIELTAEEEPGCGSGGAAS